MVPDYHVITRVHRSNVLAMVKVLHHGFADSPNYAS